MSEDPTRGPAATAPAAKGRLRFGPAWVVTAAFIGPGTVTTATIAGASYGAALLWTLLVATFVTIALQEMVARVTLATGKPFGAALRERFTGPRRLAIVGLVVASIAVGNTAFQVGNIAGAGLALQSFGQAPLWPWAIIVADLAFLALWFGAGAYIETILKLTVAAIGFCFLLTLALAPVDWVAAAGGLVPSLPSGSSLLALGLIGTTVVPYNLFLHSSLITGGLRRSRDAGVLRADTVAAVAAGGAFSAAIVLTSAATIPGSAVASAGDMAAQLRPLLGPVASVAFALGLFAAGLSSAITAPLAASYAITQVLGGRWSSGGVRSPRFRLIWIAVIVLGLLPLVVGVEPVAAIVAAQALNGILLPLLAVLLVVIANDPALMGPLKNRLASNVAGLLAVAVAALLGGRLILGALSGSG